VSVDEASAVNPVRVKVLGPAEAVQEAPGRPEIAHTPDVVTSNYSGNVIIRLSVAPIANSVSMMKV